MADTDKAPDPGTPGANQGATPRPNPLAVQPTTPPAAQPQPQTAQAQAKAQQVLAGPGADPEAGEPAANPMAPRGGGRRQAAQTATPTLQTNITLDPAALGAAIAAAQHEMDQKSRQQTPTEGLDRCHPGGVYVVDGSVVNAHGERIEHPGGRG